MKLGNGGLVIAYTCTIFISAALLFLSEFMAAKMLLPLFGGTSAVWTTCMVFFQGALLLGYLYAHYSVKKLGLKYQPIVHGGLVLLALASLPFALPVWAGGAHDMPIFNILAALTIAIGVPFFVLATTGPLLQYWFASTNHPHAKNPYFLYAASNLGSFLALIAYPFAIEPAIGLRAQSHMWAVGYGIFASLIVVCTALLFTRRAKRANLTAQSRKAVKTTWNQRVYWLFLAALPSSLMLGVTSYITTDVASMPMLWMVPLALYLLTFVVAFGYAKPQKLVTKIAPITAAGLVGLILLLVLPNELPRVFNALFIIIFFVFISLLAHGKLSVLKPGPAGLTEFYLWVAAGGVAGGMFNSLVAPVIFNDVYEFPVALLLSILVIVPLAGIRKAFNRYGLLAVGFGLVFSVVLFAVNKSFGSIPEQLVAAVIGGVLVIAHITYNQKPIMYGAFLLPLLLVPVVMLASSKTLLSERTFYSVLKVFEFNGERSLRHGVTMHGTQSTDPKKAREPASYYHVKSPVGDIFKTCREINGCRNIGVLGLGVGTIAAYGRQGDNITFYEIDPAVKNLAYDKNFFTYISNSNARIQTVIGDGRLTLDDDDKQFDVLLVDAFSSDAIPTHLLTSEAVQLYKKKLADGGLLALHISNNNLNLEPIVKAVAREQNLHALFRRDSGSEIPSEARPGSQWVVLSMKPEHVNKLQDYAEWRSLQGKDVKVWNDDYSNVLDALYL